GVAASFHDKARSARFCIPAGYKFRLWPVSNKQGTPEDLVGSGSVNSKTWTSNPNWSSSCFANASGCLLAPQCGNGVCEGAESPLTCSSDCGCAHSKCEAGAALSASCDLGVATICDVDSYCCTTAWDSICTSEVRTVTDSLICEESAGSCSHTLC